MFLIDKSNYINELLGYEYVQFFACIASIMSAYYLCGVYRDKLKIIMGPYIFKMLVFNAVGQIVTYKFWTEDKGKFVVNLLNLLIGMIIVAVVKITSTAKISEILLVTLLHDVVSVIFFIGPYYLIRHFISNDKIYFYNSPNVLNSLLLVFVLTVWYLFSLWILNKIFKKLGKYYRLKNKIVIVITYIVFIVAMLSTFTNYYDTSVYKNGNMIVLFIFIVFIGTLLPYLASIYSRKRDTKKELTQKEILLEEKKRITKTSDNVKEVSEEDRKFRHDIDKHMNVIKEMVDEGASEEEVREYAEGIKETYK